MVSQINFLKIVITFHKYLGITIHVIQNKFFHKYLGITIHSIQNKNSYRLVDHVLSAGDLYRWKKLKKCINTLNQSTVTKKAHFVKNDIWLSIFMLRNRIFEICTKKSHSMTNVYDNYWNDPFIWKRKRYIQNFIPTTGWKSSTESIWKKYHFSNNSFKLRSFRLTKQNF